MQGIRKVQPHGQPPQGYFAGGREEKVIQTTRQCLSAARCLDGQASRPSQADKNRRCTIKQVAGFLLIPSSYTRMPCRHPFDPPFSGQQCGGSDVEGPVEAGVQGEADVRAASSTPTPRPEVGEAEPV